MSEIKFTKTATFLFPLLEIPKQLFSCHIKDTWGRLKYDNRFFNAFLKHEDITAYQDEEHVFILTRNYRDVDFNKFYSTLCALPNYVDDYDNDGCLISVFTVPEARKPDFTLIRQGKYSEVSPEAKKLILSNNFFSGKPFTLPLILNKSEALKESWEERLSNPGSPAYLYDQEVWPIIDICAEVLTKNIIKSYSQKQELLPSGEF
jgi:hypothetical protein